METHHPSSAFGSNQCYISTFLENYQEKKGTQIREGIECVASLNSCTAGKFALKNQDMPHALPEPDLAPLMQEN